MIDGALLLFHAETEMVAAQALSVHQEHSAKRGSAGMQGCYRFLPMLLLSAARPPPLLQRLPVGRPKKLILPGLVAVGRRARPPRCRSRGRARGGWSRDQAQAPRR